MRILKAVIGLVILAIIIGIGSLYFTHLYGVYSKESAFLTSLSTVATSISTIGSLLLLVVTFFYFLETRDMAKETRRQRELLEEPAVSIKILPDEKSSNFLYMVMKNTGGGPAYDISVSFDPDIPYGESTLNGLKMFNKMPLLDKGEETKFFFASAIEYFKSDMPKETKALVTYFLVPKSKNDKRNKYNKPIIREFTIDIEEKKGQSHLIRRDVHDLVNEIEELKQVLLIASLEKKVKNHD
jgi:hypothetical protein